METIVIEAYTIATHYVWNVANVLFTLTAAVLFRCFNQPIFYIQYVAICLTLDLYCVHIEAMLVQKLMKVIRSVMYTE